MAEIPKEIYISIDIETSGPTPCTYSILSIGACNIYKPEEKFYIEMQPINNNFLHEAIDVCGLDLGELKDRGIPAKKAMSNFMLWLKDTVPHNARPIFVAMNAPFDWMFVNDYFYRFLGQNPFGHNALDIKALYMGLAHCSWKNASMARMAELYLDDQPLTHHALQDALDQAQIFRGLMKDYSIKDTLYQKETKS